MTTYTFKPGDRWLYSWNVTGLSSYTGISARSSIRDNADGGPVIASFTMSATDNGDGTATIVQELPVIEGEKLTPNRFYYFDIEITTAAFGPITSDTQRIKVLAKMTQD